MAANALSRLKQRDSGEIVSRGKTRTIMSLRKIARSPVTNNSLRDTSGRETSASERASNAGHPALDDPGVGVKSVGEENEMNHLHALLRCAAMFTRLRCGVSMIFPGYLSSGEESRVGCVAARFNESFYANRRDRTGREVSRWRGLPSFDHFDTRGKLFSWNLESHETMYQHGRCTCVWAQRDMQSFKHFGGRLEAHPEMRMRCSLSRGTEMLRKLNQSEMKSERKSTTRVEVKGCWSTLKSRMTGLCAGAEGSARGEWFLRDRNCRAWNSS